MNRGALHRSGLLSALLLLSVLSVPLSHGLRHFDGTDAAPVGPSVEAWCDFCHQPFVALATERPVLAASSLVVAAYTAPAPAPGAVKCPVSEPRGPPVAV